MVEAPDHTRPSPDALLKAAEREGRGKLKIFLGAAPGVGKTYEMLAAARRRKAEGVDVVAGLVETHGRAETEAQLVGLDVVPRRKVEYKGRALDEMDIDAILKRRPQLVLVDELAHTNAEGSRHPKRYMDVEELLTAGIDVYSTLNVQHIESLNDVVARITRIRVRETVPDRVLNAADEVELVDLTPADLIGRLNEGKVYVREQAQRALRHYFSPGNLTALARAGAAAHRRARRRADAELHARARHRRPVGGGRARDRLPRSQPGRRQRRARRQAHGGRARCRADRALCRDRPAYRAVGDRAWPSRRGDAARRAAGRGDRDPAGTLGGRGDPGLRPLAQRHARGLGQVPALALVRIAPRLGRRRAGAQQLGARDRSRVGGAGDELDRVARLAAQRAADAGPLSRGHAHHGAGDGGRRRDRPADRPAQHFPGLRRAGPGRGGAARPGAVALGLGAGRALPTTSSSCRRSTNSRSATRPTSWRCSSSWSWPSWRARSPPVRARRPKRRGAKPAPPPSSTPSAARSRASWISTTCCGPSSRTWPGS